MTPPPMITMRSGRAGNSNASVEVMTRSPSSWMKGRLAGSLPVAIRMRSALICSVSPPSFLTSRVWASTKEPNPLRTVMPFFSIRKSTPATVWSTTSCLRAIIRGKSMPRSDTWIPWMSNSFLALR